MQIAYATPWQCQGKRNATLAGVRPCGMDHHSGTCACMGPPTVPNPPRDHDDHCGGNGSGLVNTCAE
jgi:hypothetical protein